jgi:hypothetical protein
MDLIILPYIQVSGWSHTALPAIAPSVTLVGEFVLKNVKKGQ